MRKTDILLVLLFIVLVLGLAFGPGLIKKWRADDAVATSPDVPREPVEETQGREPAEQLTGEEAMELERVNGMLMLHEACVDRFDDFGEESQAIVDAWKQHHAKLLEQNGAQQDFRIVLSQPEGLDEAAVEKAREEERTLCGRNLEAMRAELEEDDDTD